MDDGRARLQFGFSFGQAAPAARRPDEETPFRILVLADLGGGATVCAAPLAIDIDNFDRVFARIAPKLAITLDDTPLQIDFGSLDDFHPDRLLARLAPLKTLRQLRAQLADPDQYAAAAQALGGAAPAPAAPDAGSDIERLLGRKASPAAASAGGIERWVKDLVAPFVVPNIAHEQKQWLDVVDAAIGEQLRRVLHHPAFQALEANWRGIDGLVRQLELGEILQLCVADAPRGALLGDLAAAGDDLARSTLYRHLCGPATEATQGKRWSLLVVDGAFGPQGDEPRLLTALGLLAARAGAPVVAGARPEAVGGANVEALADRTAWASAETAARDGWNELRRSETAAWIGLVLPRLLMRLPYGAATDPTETIAFEELAAGREPGRYLWGSPVYALALLAGQAFASDGWGMTLDGAADVTDLPTHSFREDGETRQQTGVEAVMTESAGAAALARGIMPLLAFRNRDVARLLRWQSLAEPPAPLAGAWR